MRRSASGPTLSRAGSLTLSGTQGSGSLNGSLSAADLRRRSARQIAVGPFPGGITLPAMLKFLFPAKIEHPDSTGRLELCAIYGPIDADGCLRGGCVGQHAHTNLELHQMVLHSTREALYKLHDKPRDTVETMVEELLPMAMARQYSREEVQHVLRSVPMDSEGRMDFHALQDLVLKNRKRRLRNLLKDGKPRKLEKTTCPYQSEQTATLLKVASKKRVTHPEQYLQRDKRMNSYACLVAPYEVQNNSDIVANTALIRPLGDVDDKWDRYCAVRRTGRSSYVQARNSLKPGIEQDAALADTYPGCSSLVSSHGPHTMGHIGDR